MNEQSLRADLILSELAIIELQAKIARLENSCAHDNAARLDNVLASGELLAQAADQFLQACNDLTLGIDLYDEEEETSQNDLDNAERSYSELYCKLSKATYEFRRHAQEVKRK